MAKVRHNNALIALSLIVICAVIVAFMLTKEAAPVDNSEVKERFENGAIQNFNVLSLEAWGYVRTAQQDIQELTPGQQIGSGIVTDPTNPAVSYFISSAPDPDNEMEMTLYSVYAYNTEDYTFERIYRVSYGFTRDPERTSKGVPGLQEDIQITLQPVGYDSGKLIILAQDAESPPGPCAEFLTLGRLPGDKVYEMLSLNLLDPFAQGLQTYEVPEDIHNQALERQNECASQ